MQADSLVMASPVGFLRLKAEDDHLTALEFLKSGKATSSSNSLLLKAKKQLEEYFAGKRTQFDLPLKPEGTEFQLQAWQQLRKIPFGQTITYGEQAKRLGAPKKARAVGQANGRNPISIIVPCHRVIGSTGKLTGFGGGIKNKEILLALEQGQQSF